MNTLDRCRCHWEVATWPDQLLSFFSQATGGQSLANLKHVALPHRRDLPGPVERTAVVGELSRRWFDRFGAVSGSQLLRFAAFGSDSGEQWTRGWRDDFAKAVENPTDARLEELRLRSKPAREQWDGYGRGLLKTIQRQLEAEGLAVASMPHAIDDATPQVIRILPIIPLSPIGGAAAVAPDTILWEAHLYNPVPAVPEVVRLAAAVTLLHVAPRADEEALKIKILAIALDAGRKLDLVTETATVDSSGDSWVNYVSAE